MPKEAMQAHSGMDAFEADHWAETVGEATALVIGTCSPTQRPSRIGYRALSRHNALGQDYSNERLEAASKRALELDACSYQVSVDSETFAGSTDDTPAGAGKIRPRHENIRADAQTSTLPPTARAVIDHHKGKNMLNNRRLKKLHSIKLHGMADASMLQWRPAE